MGGLRATVYSKEEREEDITDHIPVLVLEKQKVDWEELLQKYVPKKLNNFKVLDVLHILKK